MDREDLVAQKARHQGDPVTLSQLAQERQSTEEPDEGPKRFLNAAPGLGRLSFYSQSDYRA